MNNLQLVGSFEALVRLSQKELPAIYSLRLKKLLYKAKEEIQLFESVRLELLNRYGFAKEGATNYEFETQAKKLAWEQEYNELLLTEADIKFEQIPIKVLIDNNISISSSDLLLLDWLIIEEDNNDKEKKNNQ
jgi:hypothetical protein